MILAVQMGHNRQPCSYFQVYIATPVAFYFFSSGLMQGTPQMWEQNAPLRTTLVSSPEVSQSCQFRE